MIYLDANAFYWYYGREKLSMKSSVPTLKVKDLCDFLDSRTDKSLPASVLVEIIVHFRDCPETIKGILSFCEKKGIRIYNNIRDYCFSSDSLTIIQDMSSDILKQYANNLLDKKIEIEVYHTYSFLQIVSLLYAKYYLESCNQLTSEERNKILSYLGKASSKELKDDYFAQITSVLKSGYSDDKSQQYLKKEYIDLLVQNCVIFRMITDTAVKYLRNEQNLYAAMCKSAEEARNNGCTDSNIMQTIVDTLTTDTVFLKLAEDEIPAMFLRKGYSKHQAEYLKMLLQAWLERGQKLRKNDIFDMLCVGALDKSEINPQLNILVDQSSYLISFDKIMMDFICQNSWNADLINRFKL